MGENSSEAPRGDPPVRRSLLPNVRTRVLISFLVLLVVSTAASLLVLRSVLLSRIGDEVQETLTAQVESLRTIAGDIDPVTGDPVRGDLRALFDSFLARERPLADGVLVAFVEGEQYRTSPQGVDIARLFAELGTLATIRSPAEGEIDTRAGTARFVGIPVRVGGERGALVAAKLLAGERDRVEDALRIALATSLVVMLLASLFIWLATSRAMAPLHALSHATRTITETDLSGRVSVRGADEIAGLGRTFNGMLDRLETAFADQKEFLADVGHELRTPITVIRGHIETLGDDPAERHEATTVVQDELDRMSRLVDDLLLLARADRPDFLHLEPLDLDLLTNDLFTKMRTLGERRWSLEGIGVGLVHADPHRLTSAVMNLAQNAVRHTRSGEAISFGSAMSDGTARIWVRDEGPGIHPDEQERIFERFAHTGVAPGGGAGLGLAIVRAIADAHGGQVELESRLGLGATFTIVLPVDEPDPAEPA